MFEKYLSLWGKENLLERAFKRTCKMLDYDREMFDASVQALRYSNTAKPAVDIYEMDKKINKYEREVRRNVLTHLAISGKKDVVPGLSLVSIVIDVERIGDYTKNIADLAGAHPKKLAAGEHEELLKLLEKLIAERFEGFSQMLLAADETLARRVMATHQEISEGCEKITIGMVKYDGAELDTKSAVTLALYARYLKRISGHLTNIASSVVNPFPRIGYREKTKRTS
ncbi:MAG TPA: PhoU domain-containing protein [candidate division Zixibacteria bacterium]|nr:PhoU domain-containing protein [candidate division Zixibacteria bacterium]